MFTKENLSEAKLLYVDELEVFTVNPAGPEEVGGVSNCTVQIFTLYKIISNSTL